MAPSVAGSTLASRPHHKPHQHLSSKAQNGASSPAPNFSAQHGTHNADTTGIKASLSNQAFSQTIDRRGYFLATGTRWLEDGATVTQMAVIYYDDIRNSNDTSVDGDNLGAGVQYTPTNGENWEGVESGVASATRKYFRWCIKSDTAARDFKIREYCGIAVDSQRSWGIYKADSEKLLFTKTLDDGERYEFHPDYYCVDEQNLPGYPDDVYLCMTYKDSEDKTLGRLVAYYEQGEAADDGEQPTTWAWVEGPDVQLDTTRGDPWAARLLDVPVLDRFECCIAGNASNARKNALVGDATRGLHDGLFVLKDGPPASNRPSLVLQDRAAISDTEYWLYSDYYCYATERQLKGGPFS